MPTISGVQSGNMAQVIGNVAQRQQQADQFRMQQQMALAKMQQEQQQQAMVMQQRQQVAAQERQQKAQEFEFNRAKTMAELGEKYGGEFDMDHDPATGRVKFSRKKAGLTKEEEKWNKEKTRTTTLLTEMFPEYAEKNPAELDALAEAELTDKQRIDHLNDVVGKQKMESIARDTVTQALQVLWPEFSQMPPDFTENALSRLEKVVANAKSQSELPRAIEDIREASQKKLVFDSLIRPPTNPTDMQMVKLLKDKHFPKSNDEDMVDKLIAFQAMQETKNSPASRRIDDSIESLLKELDSSMVKYNEVEKARVNKDLDRQYELRAKQQEIDNAKARNIIENRKQLSPTPPPAAGETMKVGGEEYDENTRKFVGELITKRTPEQRAGDLAKLQKAAESSATDDASKKKSEFARKVLSFYKKMAPQELQEGTEETVGPPGTPVEEEPQKTTPTVQPTATKKKSGITLEQFNNLHGTERGAKLVGPRADSAEAPEEGEGLLSIEEIRELRSRADRGDEEAKAILMLLLEAARTAKQ